MGIALHQVAGHVPAFGQAVEVAAEALSGQLGAAEIPACQGIAAQQQFTGGAGAAWFGLRVLEGELHMRQRQADGRNFRPDRRIAAQLVCGDDVAFRRSVVVVQF